MKVKIKKLMGLYRQLSLPLKVSVWFFFCSVLQKGLSFLATPIFTRILSTEEYGLISVFNSWERIIAVFVTFGLENSISNVGYVKFSDDKNRFQASILGLAWTCACFFSCLFLCFYRFLEPMIQLDISFIELMLVYCTFSTTLTMWSVRERFEYHYRRMVAITLCNTISGTLLSVVLVFIMQEKAFAKVLGTTIITTAIGLFCFVDTFRRSPKLYSGKYWKFALKYNFPMIPHFLSSILLNQLDRIMIKNMSGSSQAGIYSVAYSSAGVVQIINSALSASYNPWLLQRLKEKKYDGIKENVNAILTGYVWILVLIILFAPEIMSFMATAEYYEGIYVIPPVACSMFFILLFNVFAPIEHYSLKTKFIAAASVISAIANIALNFIGIRIFGYLAAGYTTLICYMIYALAHFIYMKKVCMHILGVTNLFDEKKILYMSIFVVIIAISSAFVYRTPLVRYFLIIGIIIAAFANRHKIICQFSVIRKGLKNSD